MSKTPSLTETLKQLNQQSQNRATTTFQTIQPSTPNIMTRGLKPTVSMEGLRPTIAMDIANSVHRPNKK